RPATGLLYRPAATVATALVPSPAMGGLLVGVQAVGGAALGGVLGQAAIAQPQGYALGPSSVHFGGLPLAVAWRRMAPLSIVVRAQCARRSTWHGRWDSGHSQAL